MRSLIRNLLWAALLATPALAAADAAVEIRFHPQSRAWAHELEAARHLYAATVQNTAVINHGSAAVTVEQVRYEAMRGDDVVVARVLHARDLDAAAAGGHGLAGAGLFDVLQFQFAPDVLFGGKPALAATRTLAPGEALYVPVQLLAFPGQPELVRVTVDFAGDVADAVSTLPLRYGTIETVFQLPLHGPWLAGSGSTPHSHHRWAVPEEFAFDFVRYGDTHMTYRGDGTKPEDYYAYGEPVYAAAAGEVVFVRGDMPDSVEAMRRPDETLALYFDRLRANQDVLLAAGVDRIPGNHVVIRHADGVYSVYGHLKPGSIVVAVGAAVAAGQEIAAVGTSGNSTEPHLHFHVCDAADALLCNGLPVRFTGTEIPVSEGPRQIQTGDLLMPEVGGSGETD